MAHIKWVPVLRCDTYEISNFGQVRRRFPDSHYPAGYVLRQHPNPVGYMLVKMSRGGKLIQGHCHRLVAESFIRPLKKGDVVNHKNGIKWDNRLDNLEITDHMGNTAHAVENGLLPTKITYEQAIEMRAARRDGGRTYQSIADEYGVSYTHAWNVCNDKKWKEENWG